MKNVRFVEDREVRQDGVRILYEKGKVYAFSDPSADRWVRRGHEEASSRASVSEPRIVDDDGNPAGLTADQAKGQAAAAERDAKAKADAEEAAKEAAARAERDRVEAEERAVKAAQDAERLAVKIPANWQQLPFADQRALAAQLTDETVRSKEDAAEAIEAELKRRGG